MVLWRPRDPKGRGSVSQVKFRAECREKPVEVMAGWDRPLRHYYLTVFDLSEEEVVWSTLGTVPGGGCASVGPLAKALIELGIEEPEGFWDHVKMPEGNVTVTFVEGAWRKEKF